MTLRNRSDRRCSLPVASALALGRACSPRVDIAEPRDGGTSGSAGDAGKGGALATGGAAGSGESQGGNAGIGGMNGSGSATGGGSATSTGGASGTGAVVGCDASNTELAPENGVIAEFMGSGDIAGEISARGTPLPTYMTNGVLHIMVDAPATNEILSVGIHFDSCVDATRFNGVQFSVNASLADCPSGTEPAAASLGLVVVDSGHLYDDGSPMSHESHGTGPPGSIPAHAWLTSAQVTSGPQTVTIPFVALSGYPATPFDEAKLTGVRWAFSFQGSCVADVTIDDVRFY